MILVDTSFWIAYFNGKATPETDALDGANSAGLAGCVC